MFHGSRSGTVMLHEPKNEADRCNLPTILNGKVIFCTSLSNLSFFSLRINLIVPFELYKRSMTTIPPSR